MYIYMYIYIYICLYIYRGCLGRRRRHPRTLPHSAPLRVRPVYHTVYRAVYHRAFGRRRPVTPRTPRAMIDVTEVSRIPRGRRRRK